MVKNKHKRRINCYYGIFIYFKYLGEGSDRKRRSASSFNLLSGSKKGKNIKKSIKEKNNILYIKH